MDTTVPDVTTVRVELGERSYPIYIGAGLFDDPSLLTRHIAAQQVLIVTDGGAGPLYAQHVADGLGEHDVEILTLPTGEHEKTLENLGLVFDALLGRRFNRKATLIAVGGGVVGDMAGFAAACYQRGVPYLQFPTTLLAQVDSSVGGKTAVNHPMGKNMIGAFYQPRAVVADITTLDSLPDRELLAGLAEVIKYGVLWDAAFFEWIEANLEQLLERRSAALSYAVRRSCEIKAEVVKADERENDVRALLNLGHTFGHAIETGSGYGLWLHGEAVAAGICMAADTAVRLGWLSGQERGRIVGLIKRAGLPVEAPAALEPAEMLAHMQVDKKAVDGGIRLVLPLAIGRTSVTGDFDVKALRDTLEYCRA